MQSSKNTKVLVGNSKKGKIPNSIQQRLSVSLHNLFPGALKEYSKVFVSFKEEATKKKKSDSEFFDLAYEFRSPVLEKEFVVLDCFTKTPITENIVKSFHNKIMFAQSGESGLRNNTKKRYLLREKTLGILVGESASKNVVNMAKKRGISLLFLRDFNINKNDLALQK